MRVPHTIVAALLLGTLLVGATAQAAPVDAPLKLIRGEATTTRQNLILNANFETCNFSQFDGMEAAPHEILIVNTPVRAGRCAGRFLIRKNDWNIGGSKRRAEAKNNGAGGPNIAGAKERWFALSVYLPPDWYTASTAAQDDIVFQIHDRPDSCETFRHPPLVLSIVNNQIRWQVRWDAKRCSTWVRGPKTVFSTPIIKGGWMDFVVHVRWSFQSDGFTEVWYQGQKVARYNGPVGYNDGREMYLKTGIYRTPWPKEMPSSRVVYIDEVRIGNANATYADMAPGN